MKILVIYATAGAGHKKAAEAVDNGLKALGGHDVHYVDVLDHTNRLYKHLYSKTYSLLITHVPWLWGFFFWLLDVRFLLPLIRLIRRLHNALNARAFHRYLIEEQFDVIVSTHFFPNEVAAYLKRNGKISSRIVCAVTDYDAHSIWLSQGIDDYAVATEYTKSRVCSFGVAADRVHVTGIPTDKKFSSHQDPLAIKRKLGLREDVFTVLIATGSFGIGPIEEIIEQLNGVQALVVCGHNQSLYQKLSAQKKELAMIYGLVDNMDELMAAADAMITKPGGLSISEALVSGLPLIFFNAIPGQETNNIKVLKENGVGISGCSIEDMAAVLNRWSADPAELEAAKQRSRALGRPRAVEDIISIIQ